MNQTAIFCYVLAILMGMLQAGQSAYGEKPGITYFGAIAIAFIGFIANYICS